MERPLPPGYEISFDRERLDFDVIHGFLKESYWSPDIRRDIVERAAANSLVAGCYHGDDQVAFARVISDGATFAYLCDVFVLPQHAGKGIAKALVQAFIDRPDMQTLRRWLLATRDAHDVYRPLGYTEVNEGRWMEIRMPFEGWQEDVKPEAR